MGLMVAWEGHRRAICAPPPAVLWGLLNLNQSQAEVHNIEQTSSSRPRQNQFGKEAIRCKSLLAAW
jgi:hypothetical protein